MVTLHASVALGILIAGASAQTFIVDANNGPGTNYRDIESAVGAVPDGAVLHVRAGTYTSFTVPDKALTILGLTPATVRVDGFTVTGTAPSRTVVVAGMTTIGLVAIAACNGPVQLTDIASDTGVMPPRLQIANSPNVHVHRVTLAATGFVTLIAAARVEVSQSRVEFDQCNFVGIRQPTVGATGVPAMNALASRLSMFRSTLLGGGGGSDGVSSFGAGGPGLLATDCTIDLGPGNSISGGPGGIDPDILGCYTVMAPGGAGLRLVRSQADAKNTALRGGDGPCRVCITAPCNNLGPPSLLDASSSLRQVASAPVTASSGVLQIGGYLDLRVTGEPQELALLVFGFSPTMTDLAQIVDFGGILCMPDIPYLALNLDGAGIGSYRLPLPTGFQTDRVVWAQFFTFPGATLPGNGSNSVPFVVRS